MNEREKSINDRVTDFYRAERISNALLFLIGGGAIVWTFLLYIWRQGHLSTGLFYSALPLSLFFVITAAYRFRRSIKRYRALSEDPEGIVYLKEEERPHLEGRLRRFLRKRKVDLTGFLLGFLFLVLSAFLHWNHIFLATSLSITVFSSILLAFDLFGQFRTEELLHHIRKIEKNET